MTSLLPFRWHIAEVLLIVAAGVAHHIVVTTKRERRLARKKDALAQQADALVDDSDETAEGFQEKDDEDIYCNTLPVDPDAQPLTAEQVRDLAKSNPTGS